MSVTSYPDRGGIGKDTVWPSLAALNSSTYTGDGPGSRAWYMDGGVRREAEYLSGIWSPVAPLIPAPPSFDMRAVFIGDSQTQVDTVYYNNAHQVSVASSWTTFLCAASGGRIKHLKNVAVGSQNTAQMLARFDADVLAFDPDCVFIAASINDASKATVIANTTEMVKRCKSYRSPRAPFGVRVILVTTPPTGSFDGTYPVLPGAAQLVSDINNWKQEYARSNNIPLIDFYGFFVDPLGTYKDGATSDGTHPSFAWQKLSGVWAWDQIKGYFSSQSPILLPSGNNDPNNLFANGMILPASSARPAGWVTYGGGTMSLTCGPVSGFRGNAFTAINSGAGAQYYEYDTALAGMVGHKLKLSFQFAGPRGTASFNWMGGSYNNTPALRVGPTQSVDAGSEFITEVVVPPGATKIRLQMGAPIDATVAIGAIGVYDLTAMGLA